MIIDVVQFTGISHHIKRYVGDLEGIDFLRGVYAASGLSIA